MRVCTSVCVYVRSLTSVDCFVSVCDVNVLSLFLSV
jgi:hypothetical protein